jgi:hypothetical protein
MTDNVYRFTGTTPPQELTVDMEARFLAIGQTLSAEVTLEAYRTTLDAVAAMLDASHALEMLGKKEYDHLCRIVVAMHRAPDGL